MSLVYSWYQKFSGPLPLHLLCQLALSKIGKEEMEQVIKYIREADACVGTTLNK